MPGLDDENPQHSILDGADDPVVTNPISPQSTQRTPERLACAARIVERRDPAEILGSGNLPRFIEFKSQRGFIRSVIETEVPMRKDGTAFVDQAAEAATSLAYRETVNATGSPSMAASAGWVWTPGTELAQGVAARELVE